jgi:hypothetical protein
MKLYFPVDQLWIHVRKMGATERDFILEAVIPEPLPPILTSTGGIDVTIDEVDTKHGLLSSNGAQVVLYIPDQGRNVDSVLINGKEGRKVHVADCVTLEQMRQKNRFQRYRAVVNVTGDFEVFGFSISQQNPVDGSARLQVCINCLKHLNYRGYLTEPRRQTEIRNDFNLKDFFAEHSTLFRYLPTSFVERKAGYTEDWAVVSERFRTSKGVICEQCGLDLNHHKHLLHTHHVDGNKRNNQGGNLMALCADCHRKQPLHDYMSIRAKDMATLQRLRKEQGVLGDTTGWDELFKLVDPPFQGLLRFYKADGAAKPEIGYEVMDSSGEVAAEVAIAWPNARFAVVADDAQKELLSALGWKIQTLDIALKSFRR